MLLEFSVTNFRSIKEKQTLSLLKTKKNELENNFTTITLSTGKTLDVLNSAVIYGANASGKSNLVSAMNDMIAIILQSANFQLGEIVPVEPFLLAKKNASQPTEFELDFVENKVRFVYGFSSTRGKIIDEWLYQYPNGRPQALIEREKTNEWGAMGALKGNKKLWQDSTKENSLFLSIAAQLNSTQLANIFRAMNKIQSAVIGVDMRITLNKVKENKRQILDFLSFADINIVDIEYEEIEVPVDEIPKHQRASVVINGVERQAEKYISARISCIHKTDDNKLQTFALGQESAGTQKLFNLAGIWLNILEDGYTLILDELQNSLHPKLVEYLVKMFHNPELNKNGAQLIFVTHETSLLDQEIFRRDQIWFCEKANNATELFSLAEFKVRKGVDDLEKAYLSGRYGAVPYLR
ncbi:MAG: ATP-binding protein [Candidatus Thioglobus sp.]|nr:ATP-binding protein [Candidatus Thioglobus sp.]